MPALLGAAEREVLAVVSLADVVAAVGVAHTWEEELS